MCFFLLLKGYMMGYDEIYDGYPQVTLVIQRRGLDHHHFIAGISFIMFIIYFCGPRQVC